ncbi:hypothetical protein ACFWPA_15565 [Rhodococcus sp. NPDC058505]|uniref:hypothetical protein n=1 Tax=Rhodococcus sp. NPDC058505 TaxID=3346531 RepID=UPI003657FC70
MSEAPGVLGSGLTIAKANPGNFLLSRFVAARCTACASGSPPDRVPDVTARPAVHGADDVNFVSNDRIREVLDGTDATPDQVDAAVAVNEDTRLRTLKIGLLILAAISVTAIIPATRLPDYWPHEIPDPDA